MTAKAVAKGEHEGEAGWVQGNNHESGQAKSSMEQHTTPKGKEPKGDPAL